MNAKKFKRKYGFKPDNGTLCNHCLGCFVTCKHNDKYRNSKKNKCRHFKTHFNILKPKGM